MYGRKPADYDPAAFQGIHARYVLVIDIDPDDDKLAAQLARLSEPSTPTAGHQDRIERRHTQARLAVPGRADAMAIAFAGRAKAAPMTSRVMQAKASLEI